MAVSIAHVKPRALARRTLTSYLPIALMVALTLFPFYWMAITSLKSDGELYNLQSNPLLVFQPVLTQYQRLLNDTLFPRWITNTLLVSVASTALSLVFSALAGYSLARLRYRGATAIGWAIFITYLVPPTLLFIPLLGVVSGLHLQNTLWSLILVYPTFLIPFGTWMLIGYFKSIPRELEESALVDGATRLQAMTSIVLPLALPGLLSVGIFAFTLSWNEFIYALVFLSDATIKTIPVGVTSELIRGDSFFWGE
jgi:multiple sugar transport system permease protein